MFISKEEEIVVKCLEFCVWVSSITCCFPTENSRSFLNFQHNMQDNMSVWLVMYVPLMLTVPLMFLVQYYYIMYCIVYSYCIYVKIVFFFPLQTS